MHRKLTAIAAGFTAGLIVLTALAQTPPKKRKKKKQPPPAASVAPTPSATAEPELYHPPPEPTASPSAAPSASPPPPAAASAPAAEESKPTADEEKPAPMDHAASNSLPPWSVGALVGWGSNAAAGVGFGVRAGYTLPIHVYAGATVIYHLGESEQGATANFIYPGVEGGYELTFGPLLVRPYAGLGALILRASIPPQSVTRFYFAIWPGAVVAFAITPHLFVGGDVRYVLGGYDMLGLFATVGARF
jgi:hypothetical protein